MEEKLKTRSKKAENSVDHNTEEDKFLKSSFLNSKKYNPDLINALLEDTKLYTISEVDIMIEKFRKGVN